MIRKAGIVHLVRPGAIFSFDRYILKPLRRTYDGFIINANLVAGDPNKVAGFVRECRPTVPYVVDPKTYAFARSPELVLKKKKSWGRLLGHYGLSQESLPMRPDLSDFELRQFAAKTLEYQSTCLPDVTQLSLWSPSESLRPEVLMAPYFLFGGTSDPWFRTNLRFLSVALELKGDAEVYGVVMLSREVLTRSDELDAIASGYLSTGAAGFLIWLEGVVEQTLVAVEIAGLRRLIQLLSHDGRLPILNMFGGYLSALMSHYGLSGFCHTVAGSESRKADPPSGGLVPVFYYIPPLHWMRPAHIVDDYLERIGIDTPGDFATRICDCQICMQAVAHGLEGFTTMFAAPVVDMEKLSPRIDHDSRLYASLHYMLVKHREVKEVQRSSIGDLVSRLRFTAARYRDPALPPPINNQFLKHWADGLARDGS